MDLYIKGTIMNLLFIWRSGRKAGVFANEIEEVEELMQEKDGLGLLENKVFPKNDGGT